MSDYKMPLPFRGEIVLWYEGGVRDESRACPAIVQVESHSSLHLKVFGIDRDFTLTCVRHMDDPNAKEYDRTSEGGWDFTKPAYVASTRHQVPPELQPNLAKNVTNVKK